LHLESTLAEVFFKVSLIISVLAKRDIRKGVITVGLLLVFLLGLLGLGGFFALSRKVDGLLHQGLDHKHIQVELLANHLGLFFLASEGVADEAEFEREPVGVLRMLQLCSLVKVNLYDLLQGVPEQEVVCGRVRDFHFRLIQLHLSRGTLWCGLRLALGVYLGRRVQDFFKLRLSL